jgi:hypothetical protein
MSIQYKVRRGRRYKYEVTWDSVKKKRVWNYLGKESSEMDEVNKGDPCPFCRGHAFEIIKTNTRGEFVIKCLCCKQQLPGKWKITIEQKGD